MSIKQVRVHPTVAAIPGARERTIQNVRTEFHQLTKDYGSDEAKRQIEKKYSVVPTLAEVAQAETEARAATYTETRATNPFEAAKFGASHPEVHELAEDTRTAELRVAQGFAPRPNAEVAAEDALITERASVFRKCEAEVAKKQQVEMTAAVAAIGGK